MANKKINQLTSKASILSTDIFGIGDATTGQLFKKTIAELQAAIGGAVISVNGLVGTVVLDTDDIQELATPTNKYFTDARARGAISLTVTGNSGASTYSSGTGVLNVPTYTLAGLGGITASFLSGTSGISYNSTTGVITYSGTVYTDASIRALFSGGTGISYNSSTGAISYSGTVYTDASVRALISLTTIGSSGASTYNNTTGVINVPDYTLAGLGGISLTSLSGGTGITYNSSTGAISYSGTVYTDASIRGLFSASGSVSYNNTTGVISLTGGNLTEATSSVLTITGGTGAVIGGGTSIQVKQATTSVSGFLSSTDWTTFNNKQATITLTTTGTSGAATFSANTLNIPNYGSALSGYLLLTGGTLTGALGGTSATFSGQVNAASKYTLGSSTTGTTGQIATDGTNNYFDYIGSLIFRGAAASNTLVTFTSAGAATFSSTLISTDHTIKNSANAETLDLFLSPSTSNGFIDYPSGRSLTIRNKGSLGVLTLASTGAATFSSGIATLGYTASTSYAALFNGSVGIGTNEPAASLHIQKTSAGAATIAALLTNNDGTAGTETRLAFTTLNANPASNRFGYISYVINGVNGGDMTFATNVAGGGPVEAMRIFNDGNIYIGSSPSNAGYKLDVNGTGRFSGTSSLLYLNNTTATTGKVWRFSSASNGNFYITQEGVVDALTLSFTTGAATFSSTITANGGNILSSGATYGIVQVKGSGASTWQMFANPSDEMRFGRSGVGDYLTIANTGAATFSGNVTANGTSAFYAMKAVGSSTSGASYGLVVLAGTTSADYAVRVRNQADNADFMAITGGGNLLLGTSSDNGERLYVSGAIRATGSITANSDLTLKKNLLRIENALEKVEQINGYTYELKEDDSKRHAGVIAQEIQTVLPEIVNKGNDDILGVEYGNISALLIEAIKEQQTQIKELKALLNK